MEDTGLLVHGDFIKESRLDTLFLLSKLLTDGTSAVVDVNDIKHSQYCLQVSVVVIYTLLKKAHVESESALSLLIGLAKLPSIVRCGFTGRQFKILEYCCQSTCGQFVKVILNCTLFVDRCIVCCLGSSL